MSALFVYRGPFQGRRIRFLLDAAHRVHGTVDLVWVNPKFSSAGEHPWFEGLRGERPYLRDVVEMDGSRRTLASTALAMRRRWSRPEVLYAIGFTSLPYARMLRPRSLVWAVNGIPEERLLHDATRSSRLAVRAAWLSARVGSRPDVVIVVSDAMGRLVSQRLGGVSWTKAPTSVDVETFRPRAPTTRSQFTYVGSGAPWQGIDLLAGIWSAMHRLDPEARFRIVTRDDRAARLADGIATDRVEILAGTSAAHVASLLWEAELAFLVRMPDVVNATSFPTKFGEYVAAGVPVVSTDIGWEVGDIIRRTGCGILVDPRAEPMSIARDVLAFRDRAADDPTIRAGCERATDELGRAVWLDRLSERLKELL